MVTHLQMRAARALLELKQADVARLAGLSQQAYNAIEQGKVTPRKSNLEKIQAAFEARGIEFTNGDAPGVRLKRK